MRQIDIVECIIIANKNQFSFLKIPVAPTTVALKL